MNNLMGNLFGDRDDDPRRGQMRDFVNRYEQGSPHEGYDDDEAMQRYQQMAPNIPPDVYQESARDAFERMSPQERMQFGQYLQQQARQQGVAQQFPDLDRDGIDDRLQDSDFLAQQTSRMEQRQPGMLGQLLGGGGGGTGGMGGVSGSMGGVTSGMGSALSNPLAKVALGGIAAMAAKRMMDRR